MSKYRLNSNENILFFKKDNTQYYKGYAFKLIKKSGKHLTLIMQKPLTDFYKVFQNEDKNFTPDYMCICIDDYKIIKFEVFDDLLIDDDTLCIVEIVINTKKMEEKDYE